MHLRYQELVSRHDLTTKGTIEACTAVPERRMQVSVCAYAVRFPEHVLLYVGYINRLWNLRQAERLLNCFIHLPIETVQELMEQSRLIENVPTECGRSDTPKVCN
jgi:hypothetical protein